MTKSTNAAASTMPARSKSIDLDETQGRSALAAWRMLHWLYGAEVETWTITDNGVTATGFSTFADLDPETVIKDVSSRTRRLDFLECYPIVALGQAPKPYTDAGEITADQVQFYKGAVEEGSAKAPAYVKSAVANYKSANALAKKRGPKARTIKLDNLNEVDLDQILPNMDMEDVKILQAALERVANAKVDTGAQVAVASA